MIFDYNLKLLDIIATICGWIYAFFWTISSYPQIILNYRRKKVTGLNFDFLAISLSGYFYYTVFNVVLYANEDINKQIMQSSKVAIKPVQFNDVVFTIQTLALLLYTAYQCLIYEREEQKLSALCISFLSFEFGFVGLLIIFKIIFPFNHFINWLTILNIISYFKLFSSFIQYIPQIWMNYKRKSTIGWSIINAECDFLGGLFSTLQIVALAAKNHFWKNLFLNPVKLSLGLISVFFTFILILQHYVWYSDCNTCLTIVSTEDTVTNIH